MNKKYTTFLFYALLLLNMVLAGVSYALPADQMKQIVPIPNDIQWINAGEKKYGKIETDTVFYKFKVEHKQSVTFKFYLRSIDNFGALAHFHFFDTTGKKLTGGLDTPLIYETKDWVIYSASFTPEQVNEANAVFLLKVRSQRPITYKIVLNANQADTEQVSLPSTLLPNVALLDNNQRVQGVLKANMTQYYRFAAPPNARLNFNVQTQAKDSQGSLFTLDFLNTEGGKLSGGISPMIYETQLWKATSLHFTTNATPPAFYILRLHSDNIMEYKIGLKVATNEISTAQADLSSAELAPNRAIATSASLPLSVTKEKRLALVIGNNSYQNLSSLRNASNDATDVSKTLEKRNFKVSLLVNGSQKQMIQYIRDFGRELQKGGVGLFYYAGHGVQVNGENYLLPVNADIKATHEVKPEGVNVQRILANMSAAKNHLNIVILDACRNNPFLQQAERSINIPTGLAEMRASSGMMIAYSTGPGEVALDGKERNGIYTKHLLEQIKQPGLEMSQMFKQVRKFVRRETQNKQTPWESTSVEEDFYFTQKPML